MTYLANHHLYGCTLATCTGCVADPHADLRAQLKAAGDAFIPKRITLTPEAREMRLRAWRAPDTIEGQNT